MITVSVRDFVAIIFFLVLLVGAYLVIPPLPLVIIGAAGIFVAYKYLPAPNVEPEKEKKKVTALKTIER